MTQGLHVKVPESEHRWFSGPEFLKKLEGDYPQEKVIVYEKPSGEFLAEKSNRR